MSQTTTCFEVSVELFDPAFLKPSPRVRSIDLYPGLEQCSCQAIIQRQLTTGKWSEQFSHRIVCLSLATLGQALEVLREGPNELELTYSMKQQEQLMFDLKQICDCYKSTTDGPTINPNECGLLDLALLEYGQFTNICPVLAPVPTDSNGLMRPTPTVLKLATSTQEPARLRRSINQHVTKLMLAPVKADELGKIGSGFIYFMQRDSEPGFLKVGFSAKDPVIRHNSLRLCYPDLQIVAHTTRIPLVRRVEGLVHAELTYFRRQHDCGTCGKQHGEWFEIDIEIAKRVLLRWARWVECYPYSPNDGVLSKDWKSKVNDPQIDNVVLLINRYVKQQKRKAQDESLELEPNDVPAAKQRRRRLNSVKIKDVEKETARWDLPSRRDATH